MFNLAFLPLYVRVTRYRPYILGVSFAFGWPGWLQAVYDHWEHTSSSMGMYDLVQEQSVCP